MRLRRQNGDVAPRRQLRHGPQGVKIPALLARLPQRLHQVPGATLREHAEAFEKETGTQVSTCTVQRATTALPGRWPSRSGDAHRRGT